MYSREYIKAKEESLIGTEREGKQNIRFELMQRKVQEAATGLGIELGPEPEEKEEKEQESEGSLE